MVLRSTITAAIVSLVFLTVAGPRAARCAEASGGRVALNEGWAIQSSAYVHERGEGISAPSYRVVGWYPATVPSTVLAALVDAKVYDDPYFGTNMRLIPGAAYPPGEVFSNLPMSPDNPFRVSWWYRKEFRLPERFRDKTVWLHFNGINYRANIWLNGRRIADTSEVAGAYRIYEFDISGDVRRDGVNVLAVEVFPPRVDDLAITFVDWNPTAPDKNMGLWHEVYLTASGPVALRDPQVTARLNLPSLDTAALEVEALVKNASDEAVEGELRGRIGEVEFRKKFSLGPRGSQPVIFTPDEFPQLRFEKPRLWWPVEMGKPELYELELEAEAGGAVSDRLKVPFGIRQVTSELTGDGYRLFRINGKKILIRGAGWTPDLMLRDDPAREEAELGYVRDMHLNTVRLEGKLASDHFLDLCDRMGILVMPGWCCCAHWEHWKQWDEEDHRVAVASQRDQIRRLRRHPSVFVWLNGSDNPPPPEVERAYIRVLKENRWPNPYLSSATEKRTPVTGPTGVKMRGPYEYVPPIYWYQKREWGGAWGFNPEIGPGPAPPPAESLRRMLPPSHLWPVDEVWNYHAGGGAFKTIDVFNEALRRRYGPSGNVQEYAIKAQVQAYETHRAMFEAFGRNKYEDATGVIQWMLNDAWPSLIWHLYDYFLRPGGSYFGTKKACEPLHIQYSYDDRSVVVVNSHRRRFGKLRAKAEVYNFDLSRKFAKEAAVDAGPDSSARVMTIPELQSLSRTYFVRLELDDAAGRPASTNFYWLSTEPETLDWGKTEWYYTPTKAYADYTMLDRLKEVELEVTRSFEERGAEQIARVRLTNPSKTLAFAVRLRVLRSKDGEEVLPVLWDDNYVVLMPGEAREIKAAYRAEALGESAAVIAVDGWNIRPARY